MYFFSSLFTSFFHFCPLPLSLSLFLYFFLSSDLDGLIVTLDEVGHVQCSYLGTDPTSFAQSLVPNHTVSTVKVRETRRERWKRRGGREEGREGGREYLLSVILINLFLLFFVLGA